MGWELGAGLVGLGWLAGCGLRPVSDKLGPEPAAKFWWEGVGKAKILFGEEI